MDQAKSELLSRNFGHSTSTHAPSRATDQVYLNDLGLVQDVDLRISGTRDHPSIVDWPHAAS